MTDSPYDIVSQFEKLKEFLIHRKFDILKLELTVKQISEYGILEKLNLETKKIEILVQVEQVGEIEEFQTKFSDLFSEEFIHFYFRLKNPDRKT